MTNWCRCEVRVIGRAERVREFLEFAKGVDDGEETVFDFNRFVPYPRGRRDLDAAFWVWWNTRPNTSGAFPLHGSDKWGYSWRLDHWGTNSSASNAAYSDVAAYGERLTASVEFRTAWSPPMPVVLKASELFPDLEFDLGYFEPFGNFAGCFRCSGGLPTHDECWPCDHVEVG